MDGSLQPLTCLLLYHRQDRQRAQQIKEILEQKGAVCHLLFEVVGADMHKDIFSRADEADCVISLITQALFDEEKERKFHSKVYSYLGGEKYMAVRLNINDETYNSPAGGFLEGCHVLDYDKMSEREFQKCLVAEVRAVARRIPGGPHSGRRSPVLPDVESDDDSNDNTNQVIVTMSNTQQTVDGNNANTANLVVPIWHLAASNIGGQMLSQHTVTTTPKVSTAGTYCGVPVGPQSASPVSWNTNTVFTNSANGDCNDRGLTNQVLAMMTPNEKTQHTVEGNNESRANLGRASLKQLDLILGLLKGAAVTTDVKVNKAETLMPEACEEESAVSKSCNSCNANDLAEKEDERRENSAAAKVQPSSSFSVLTNIRASRKYKLKVQTDQTLEACAKHIRESLEEVKQHTCKQWHLAPYSENNNLPTETATACETTDASSGFTTPVMLMQPKKNTSLDQLLLSGSFSELAFKNVGNERVSVETMITTRRGPIHFLRSPFLWPILSVEEQPLGFQISTPWPSQTLKELLCLLGASIDSLCPTDVESRRSSLLRIVYHVAVAIDFLRSRRIVHENVSPDCIMIDEFENARLGDYGHHREPSAALSCRRVSDSTCESDGLSTDVFTFGITICQILKCTDERECVEDKLSECPAEFLVVADMVDNEHYVHDRLWPRGSELTGHICNISLECLRKSSAFQTLVGEIKELLLSRQPLLVATFPNDKICVYCMTETLDQSLQAQSFYCPEKCEFLRICPSCLPSISSGRHLCQIHGAQIRPPIGGNHSCALIISGRDTKDREAEETFYRDAHEMILAVSHPHVMAIPPQNIHRISPWDNFTADDINRVLNEVVRHSPDFFLLYYSGHITREGERSCFDVDAKQGHALDMTSLQESMLKLVKTCSKVLVVLDCCYAASFCPILQLEPYSSDSHINFHTVWPACGRNEQSNVTPYESNSLFTKCFVAGLKGGRQCPNGTEQCRICERFRNATEARHCVSMKTLEDFVNSHMKCRPQEGRDDHQNPVVTESRREPDPVIAYYHTEPLYKFHYEPPPCQPFPSRVCGLDTLELEVDEVLQRLWNQLKFANLPNRLDHLALQILCRVSNGSVHEAADIEDMTKAVFENPHYGLSVGIRTDGTKLDDKKIVVCFCDDRRATDTIGRLSSAGEISRSHSEERGIVKFDVKEIDQSRKAAADDVFEQTLRACWNSLLSLRQQAQSADSFLRVEIREKLSMFSIVSQTRL